MALSLSFERSIKSFSNDLEKFLLTTNTLRSRVIKLDINSASSYFDKFLIIVEKSFTDNYLLDDYSQKVDRIKVEER